MSKRLLRQQRRCIFCGNVGVSKEHMYPAWASPLISQPQTAPSYTEEQQTFTRKTILVGSDARTRPGHVTTKKIRAACTRCNNGWMNRLEGLAKPILTPLILGENLTLNPNSQELLARWAALKIIVGEYAKADGTVTPQQDRTALMESGTIPSYFRIYAAPHQTQFTTGYKRHAATVALDRLGPIPPLDGMSRNIQQTTMVMGRMVIHVNAARLDGFKIEDRINDAIYRDIRIWPIERENFEWASSRSLSANDIANISVVLDVLLADPRVAWGGDTPP